MQYALDNTGALDGALLYYTGVPVTSDDSGNLTPPITVYNRSLAADIITIAGIPLGISAILINALLMCAIISAMRHTLTYRPTYTLYLHIAFCDLLNGIAGIITASFLFENLRFPIDPDWAQQFCTIFAPLPTTIIRLLLYLMTLLAIYRVYIVRGQGRYAMVTKAKIRLTILLPYILALAYISWYMKTSVQVMALSDGWCVYYTNNYTTSDKLFTGIADAGPVIICSIIIIASLVAVHRQVANVLPAASTAPTRAQDSERIQLLVQSSVEKVANIQSIVNYILLTFLLCYGPAMYIELRQILMALGLVQYDYIVFTCPDSPPHFHYNSLLMFRLKYTLTNAFSVVNPLLVFKSSSAFRHGLFDCMVRVLATNGNFDYVISGVRHSV